MKSPQEFDTWLRGYGAAWEGRDPRAAAELFSPDAEYYWTPFDPPQRGRAEIAAAWQAAVEQQRDVRFSFEVIAASAGRGAAHWRAEFLTVSAGEPVKLDGILVADFDGPLCRTFREWWHRLGGGD